MKIVRSVVATFAAASLVLAFAPAALTAAIPAECQDQLATLRSDTVAAESAFANARDFTGAVVKLDAAAAKLAEGKTDDAVGKLSAFRAQLANLAAAPKPKIDAGTAADLIGQAEAVEACLASPVTG